jgi:hypothetical protein
VQQLIRQQLLKHEDGNKIGYSEVINNWVDFIVRHALISIKIIKKIFIVRLFEFTQIFSFCQLNFVQDEVNPTNSY